MTDSSKERTWFDDHVRAAREIAEFLAGDDISLNGRRVGDIGCGDGIIDLALTVEQRPRTLVGFDIKPVDTNALVELARAMRYTDALPRELSFKRSEPKRLPAADASFDVLVTWSAFEHVADAPALLAEVSRVLTPGGLLMLQLYPFFGSEQGSHLWPWFPGEGFVQFTFTDDEIEQRLRAPESEQILSPDDRTGEEMLREYRALNRITADELQRSLVETGFSIIKFELLSHLVRLPQGQSLERSHPLTELGVDGIKVLARSER